MSLRSKPKVRYAVVGLGHIAQAAVLPAFENAKENSELVAFVSDDPVKQQRLGRRYCVTTYTYKEYDALLDSGAVDAVYIALPNSMHRDFTVRAARCGVHVLCEKPLAVTEKDCRVMIDACAMNEVKLMTAYRLHFERANLNALEIVQSGNSGCHACSIRCSDISSSRATSVRKRNSAAARPMTLASTASTPRVISSRRSQSK